MSMNLDNLRKEHRRLDRLIDNCRSVLRQDDLKSLKRQRLQLRDRIANLQRRMDQSPA